MDNNDKKDDLLNEESSLVQDNILQIKVLKMKNIVSELKRRRNKRYRPWEKAAEDAKEKVQKNSKIEKSLVEKILNLEQKESRIESEIKHANNNYTQPTVAEKQLQVKSDLLLKIKNEKAKCLKKLQDFRKPQEQDIKKLFFTRKNEAKYSKIKAKEIVNLNDLLKEEVIKLKNARNNQPSTSQSNDNYFQEYESEIKKTDDYIRREGFNLEEIREYKHVSDNKRLKLFNFYKTHVRQAAEEQVEEINEELENSEIERG